MSLQIPKAIYLDLAFVLDLAVVDGFLLLHVTKLPLTNMLYPEVDHLSLIQSTPSTSVYALTSRFLVFRI